MHNHLAGNLLPLHGPPLDKAHRALGQEPFGSVSLRQWLRQRHQCLLETKPCFLLCLPASELPNPQTWALTRRFCGKRSSHIKSDLLPAWLGASGALTPPACPRYSDCEKNGALLRSCFRRFCLSVSHAPARRLRPTGPVRGRATVHPVLSATLSAPPSWRYVPRMKVTFGSFDRSTPAAKKTGVRP